MVKLQVSQQIDAAKWDKTICALGGTIFHSSVWADYIGAFLPNSDALYLELLSTQGELLGMALGFKSSHRRRVLMPFAGSLFLDSTPVVRDGDDKLFGEFIGFLEDYARTSGYAELAIGSYASKNGSIEFAARRFELNKRFEFEFSLSVPEEELWRKIRDTRRQKIRKGLKMGVHVHDLPPERGVFELRRLMAESARRIIRRGGPDISSRPTHCEEDPLYVLLRSDFGHVMGASVDGEVVSAALCTFFNGVVYYSLSGHSQKGLEVQAPSLLVWEAIKKYKSKGAIAFNLGGCKSDAISRNSPEHGLYNFKRAFGAELLECASATKTFHRPWFKILDVLKSLSRR